MKMLLEICCTSLESSLIAQRAGADRIELCDGLIDGGKTPSYGLIKSMKEKIKTPVRLMIRPRAGDFFYSDEEFEVMRKDILMSKFLGAEGIVFGILNNDGSVDTNRTKELVELSEPMNATFHRAFDMTEFPLEEMEKLIDCGVKTILTSGQKQKAADGIALIKRLVEKANSRIEILVGSGVTDKNIKMLRVETGATSFHMSAKKIVISKMQFRKEGVNMGTENSSEYDSLTVDQEMIRNAKQILLSQ